MSLSLHFGPSTTVQFECLHHAFAHHARLRPESTAIEHLDQCITYGDLDWRSNLLARRLRDRGIRPGRRVCIFARRSIANCIAVLAVLKAGGQYVPLDADTITESALQHVLRDSGAGLILTMEDYDSETFGIDSMNIRHIADDQLHGDSGQAPLEDWSAGSDGAYVIYTSGTTGNPKGVDVIHSGITNFLCQYPGNVGMRPGLRVAQLLNIAFDMGAWELLGAMANGSTLCLRGNTSAEWRRVLAKVDIVIATPSVLAQHYPATYPNIMSVIVGGETCPQELADRWSRHTNFYTCCGPTEISIANTVQLHVFGQRVSIGTPVPNTNVYILDEELQPCLSGEAGTMWVGGAGVSRGYLNLPETTARAWREDPFVGHGRMFNTKDLARWRSEGQLEHLGRIDNQIKIKGFRVELDGVAAAMRTCSSVVQSMAMEIDGELWGFVTPARSNPTAIATAAARVLPYYAVPTRYLALPQFSLTSNGKIDKRALRTLALRESAAHGVEKVQLPRSAPVSPSTRYVSGFETAASTPMSSPELSTPPQLSILVPQVTFPGNPHSKGIEEISPMLELEQLEWSKCW